MEETKNIEVNEKEVAKEENKKYWYLGFVFSLLS